MKHFILVLLLLACLSCRNATKAQKLQPWNPKSELGWYKNRTVMRITDHRGQEFMVDYRYYRVLFKAAGYNGVIRQFYTHPGDERFLIVSTKFYPSKAKDANEAVDDFFISYQHANAADTLYSPKPSNLYKTLYSQLQKGDRSPSNAKAENISATP